MPFIMMTCRMCDDPMSQQIAAIKMYDPVTSTLVEHALSNTDDESRVFVEVGAGTGYFSMLAASWGTDVVAFEPNATARQMLHYNAGLHKDGRVRIVPYALGAKTTLATILNQQQNSSDSSSNTTSSSSNSTAGPSPTFTPATTPTNSSTNSSKGWPVDVLRLSDAIAGDAKMTVLLVNVPSLNGVSVPGFVEAAEGAYDMLKRVQVRPIVAQGCVPAAGSLGGMAAGLDSLVVPASWSASWQHACAAKPHHCCCSADNLSDLPLCCRVLLPVLPASGCSCWVCLTTTPQPYTVC
jgi:FkbM family methyltransferase